MLQGDFSLHNFLSRPILVSSFFSVCAQVPTYALGNFVACLLARTLTCYNSSRQPSLGKHLAPEQNASTLLALPMSQPHKF